MERINRMPFQGIGNIIRFNWHLYIIALAFLVLLMVAKQILPAPLSLFILYAIILTALSILLSLAVSYYVYDCSNLYQLNWLNFLNMEAGAQLVNIHAGFDETSCLLSIKYPQAKLMVLDFYDPVKHTEVSIARARKAYPAYPGTRSISTSDVPLKRQSVDGIFTLLSAHEIRNEQERVAVFRKLRESLKEDGKIVVAEHLRDVANFIAYAVGFFHFFSKKKWTNCFDAAGLRIVKEIKITPFITAFILQKNGTAP